MFLGVANVGQYWYWWRVGGVVWCYCWWCHLIVILGGIVHGPSLEHIGYSWIRLDHCPTLHLQDYLRKDSPISRWTIFFYSVSGVPGVFVPMPGSSWSSVSYVSSRKLNRGGLCRTTTRPDLWVDRRWMVLSLLMLSLISSVYCYIATDLPWTTLVIIWRCGLERGLDYECSSRAIDVALPEKSRQNQTPKTL